MLIGRCLPYGEGITYWPLAEVAKAHAGILDNDPAEAALAKLRAAIESVVGDEHAGNARSTRPPGRSASRSREPR